MCCVELQHYGIETDILFNQALTRLGFMHDSSAYEYVSAAPFPALSGFTCIPLKKNVGSVTRGGVV